MIQQQSPLLRFDEFALKAFLIALSEFKGTFPPALIVEVNQVGADMAGGDIEESDRLICVAKKDVIFYEAFKQAYEDLLELDEINERTNFHLFEPGENTSSRQITDNMNDFVIRPLTDFNPQNATKKLFSGVQNLVGRVYGLRF